jgi:hypothetical protein
MESPEEMEREPTNSAVLSFEPWSPLTHQRFSKHVRHRTFTAMLTLRRLMPVRDIRFLILWLAFSTFCRVKQFAPQLRELNVNGLGVSITVYDEPALGFWKETDCFGLCFDLGNRSSFDLVKRTYVPMLKMESPEARVVLIGISSSTHQVSQSEAIEHARGNGFFCYLECDRTLTSVKRVWDALVCAPLSLPSNIRADRGLLEVGQTQVEKQHRCTLL